MKKTVAGRLPKPKVVRTVTRGFVVREITNEGRVVDVAIRRRYDYDDSYPFRRTTYATVEEAVEAVNGDEDVGPGRYFILAVVEVNVTYS